MITTNIGGVDVHYVLCSNNYAYELVLVCVVHNEVCTSFHGYELV
jgi:hypothetical protein